MQQTCSRCGAVATVPSKFCRQCGAPLLTETETHEAATRQYGRQTPASETPPTSHPFTSGEQRPPSVADAFAANTARLHNQAPPPPMGQPFSPSGMPAPFTPAYPAVPPAPKSSWWKYLLGFALVSLLVCGGLIGYGIKRASEVVPTVSDQVNQAIKDAQEAAERAARESGVPNGGVPDGVPVPPPPPPAPGELAKDLEQLRYPNGKVTSRVKAMGQQVISLTTTDNFDKVKPYYVKLMGEPVVETDQSDGKELVFQKSPFMVTIGNDRNAPGQLTITLIRSTLIPQLNQ